MDQTPLGAMMRHPDPRVRAQAAYVLGEIGNRSAAALLREAAKNPPTTAPLSQVRILQLQIAEALVKLGELDAIETVRASLFPSRPDDLETAALAVQIIGQVKDRRSIDQLIYLTALKDEHLVARNMLVETDHPRDAADVKNDVAAPVSIGAERDASGLGMPLKGAQRQTLRVHMRHPYGEGPCHPDVHLQFVSSVEQCIVSAISNEHAQGRRRKIFKSSSDQPHDLRRREPSIPDNSPVIALDQQTATAACALEVERKPAPPGRAPVRGAVCFATSPHGWT